MESIFVICQYFGTSIALVQLPHLLHALSLDTAFICAFYLSPRNPTGWTRDILSMLFCQIPPVYEGISAVLDSGQKYECFLYCYPSSLLTDVFDSPMVAYRALSAVFGMLLVFVVFAATRQLYNRNTALLAALFTLFAYFQIAWSTQARWYTLFSFLTWLALYFFYKSI